MLPNSFMLSITKFKSLSNTKLKEKLLWRDGNYLGLYKQKDKIEASLFALYDFYVEVFYDRGSNEVIQVKCFKSTSRNLDPYLKMIDISN